MHGKMQWGSTSIVKEILRIAVEDVLEWARKIKLSSQVEYFRRQILKLTTELLTNFN